jgi:ribosomal protein S5
MLAYCDRQSHLAIATGVPASIVAYYGNASIVAMLGRRHGQGIVAGSNHTLILTQAGQVYAWKATTIISLSLRYRRQRPF